MIVVLPQPGYPNNLDLGFTPSVATCCAARVRAALQQEDVDKDAKAAVQRWDPNRLIPRYSRDRSPQDPGFQIVASVKRNTPVRF